MGFCKMTRVKTSRRFFGQGVGAVLAVLGLGAGSVAAQVCDRFSGSTMAYGGVSPAEWRMDWPAMANVTVEEPWKAIDFKADPRAYMSSVLDTVRVGFVKDGPRLVGTGDEAWWIVPWMDYMSPGREAMMGLTKERSPLPGDLSPISTAGHQVWAIGFYNAPAAAVIGEIYADPCEPSFPEFVQFPEGSAAVKFLFTDAPSNQVSYLENAPVYQALIDPDGSDDDPTDRVLSDMKLLQVDIAVRDSRARETGWVFGTFVWLGLPRGDGLFDNLEPVSLQWGDDPRVTSPRDIRETWINQNLNGVVYGWAERPWLGFMGRANGPADNIRSSCISCHASSRLPAAPGKRLLNGGFHMTIDLADRDKVEEHVDTWFINLPAGMLFNPDDDTIAVSALDYSLQLDVATFRMCRACEDNKLTGATPQICIDTNHYQQPQCGSQEGVSSFKAEFIGNEIERSLREYTDRPPRQ